MKYDKNFSIAIDKIESNITNTLEEIGQFGAAESQARSPVDTGRMRRDIGYKTNEDSVAIGGNTEYIEFVHNGTSRQKSQPFIKDAIMQNVGQIIAIAKKHNNNV